MKLESLNPAQREVVLKTEGPVMVLAGAGSGKTRTLVNRISHLLQEKDVSAFRILALTFSNKAAKEMRERIARDVNVDIRSLQVTTFHSFCSWVLRSEANYLGLSRSFTIYDESESKAVVKALLGRRGISTKEISPYDILSFIDHAKNQGHYLGRIDTPGVNLLDDFYSYFEEYERELHKSNAVDFGGLITGVLQLFDRHPETLKTYLNRFHYVLVDEYQDTNRAQYDLVKLLVGERQNLCVVGDEDQSIYSWRGADIRNILDFEKDYPEAKLIKLEQNYRSSKTIIEAAGHVIANNSLRKGKTMWTENPEGDALEIVECSNDHKEADFVTDEIQNLIKAKNDYSDIALFYRTNAQSRILEDYLRKKKIPYRIIGGIRFYERKEIKDMLAYMRLIANSKDSLALSRIINVPARGIGATSLRKIEEEAIRSNLSLWELIEDYVRFNERYDHIKLSAKVRSALSQLVELILEVRNLNEAKVEPVELYEKLLHESGYHEFLRANKDYETQARLENLEELGNAIKDFEKSVEEPTLLGFLETITLDSQTQNAEAGEEVLQGEVALMTIHGAKGLEFPYAFIVGAEENVFPSYQSLENGGIAIEEERRLFYVAMTRAMKKLWICFAQGRMLFGQLNFNGPSRFVLEIPQNYYKWKKVIDTENVRGAQAWQSQRVRDEDYVTDTPYDFDDAPVVYQTKTPLLQNKYPKGSTVRHSLYGEGLVLESEGSGKDEKVLIRFSDGARKKFMANIAPLTIVK